MRRGVTPLGRQAHVRDLHGRRMLHRAMHRRHNVAVTGDIEGQESPGNCGPTPETYAAAAGGKEVPPSGPLRLPKARKSAA